jgi:uroporphyrinogen-III synthase
VARVVLLRERSGTPDPYEAALRARGLDPVCVPVLRYTFENAPRLRAAVTDERLGDLVLTSPRAVEALARLGLRRGWAGRSAWTVGAETARRARRLGLSTRGESAGSAERLGAEIRAARPERDLLFVCGDRRRDVLPDELRAGGLGFREIEAYRTHLRPPPILTGEAPRVIGFFSPSGVEAALSDAAFPWHARRIAIGPTTAAALDEAGYPAGATAEQPTPESCASAARRALER